MKKVRTIVIGYDCYIVPESMSEKELIVFLGTLGTLQKVQALHDKEWRKSFHFPVESTTVSTKTIEMYNSESDAQVALDAYNAEQVQRDTVLA